ncbi:MAG TPA: hypothetical protein VKZ50_05110 [bacterium]|nr:hypothetical protein [bacterium]
MDGSSPGRQDARETAGIRDGTILARVRKLVRALVAGHHDVLGGAQHVCLEPACGKAFGQTCVVFQTPGGRCPAFEGYVLPILESAAYDPSVYDPDFAEAYRRHVQFGERARTRICQWRDETTGARCLKRVASMGPNAKYCEWHRRKAELDRKKAWKRRANGAKVSPTVDVLEKSVLGSP